MRFMLMVKATPDSEAGKFPSKALIQAMGKFNEEMVQAGVLVDAAGLHPTSKGTRVRLSDGTVTITDGPFAETKEQIGGFWMIRTESQEEALEWVKRTPNPSGEGSEGEIEIRQAFDGCQGMAFAARNESLKSYLMIYRPEKYTAECAPTPECQAAMGELIGEMVSKGILLGTEGLLPLPGVRVHFSGKSVTVTDGPFTETKEQIGGFALVQVESKAEAIALAERFLRIAGDGVSEIRPVFEACDFPAELFA